MTLGKVHITKGIQELFPNKKDLKPTLLYYDNTFYAVIENKLFYLDSYLLLWSELQVNLNFYEGQSITVTSKGIVLFGGKANGKFTNQMYLFSNPTVIPIINEMTPRAYHSCCWLEHLESICICCGKSDEPVNEIYIFNMNTWEINSVVPLNPLFSVNSQVSYIRNDLIGIIGNFNSEDFQDTTLVALNLKDGRMQAIESSSVESNFNAIRSFVRDNRFFAVMPDKIWVYDFEHNQWILFEIQNIYKDGTYFFEMDSETFAIFSRDLSQYITVTFKTMVKFVEDLVDYNIETKLFDINSVKISNRVDVLFKSVYTNANRVVSSMRTKGYRIPYADRILRLLEEHRLLQMAAFRLDDARTRLGMLPPDEKIEEISVADVEKRMRDIDQKLKKYRADKSTAKKSGEMEINGAKQNIAKIDRQIPGPILPGQNPLDVAEALADAIKKQRVEYEKLRIKSSKEKRHHIASDSFFYGMYELDALEQKVAIADKKLNSVQKIFTEESAAAAKKWSNTIDGANERNGSRQFASASAIERWITTESEHCDLLLENLRRAASFLKSFPDSPKALAEVKEASERVRGWISRLSSSAPNDTNLIEEIYMNISWASAVF